MSFTGILFWLLMIVAVLFGGFFGFSADPAGRRYYGFSFLLWILLALCGYGIWGNPFNDGAGARRPVVVEERIVRP